MLVCGFSFSYGGGDLFYASCFAWLVLCCCGFVLAGSEQLARFLVFVSWVFGRSFLVL